MAFILRRSFVGLAALVAACSSGSSNNDTASGEQPGVDSGAPADPGPDPVVDAGPTTPESDGAPKPFEPILTQGPPDYLELGPKPASFDLEIAAGTLGFTFDTGGVAVTKVTDPEGTSYVPGDRPPGPREEYRRLTRFPASSKMLKVPPGTWKIELAGPSGAVKVVRQRTGDGQFHGGTLDLTVHLPTGVRVGDFLTGEAPAEALTVANADANQVVKKFLQAYFRDLKRVVGLERGAVTFVEADAQFLTIDSAAEQDAALKVAGGLSKLDRFGLHMLFTELIQTTDVVGFAASAGGIGFDRPLGTVLVKMKNQKKATEDPQTYIDKGYGPGDLSAGAALHETFHLWGLPHTSDTSVGYDDGFTDNVSCTAVQQNTNPFLCPDADNGVFPFITSPASKISLSAHQLAVIRGMPVYKPNAN